MKRVVIFGGTGFIGRYIVNRLAKEGYLIRIFTRDYRKASFLKLCGNLGQISIFEGDFFNEKLLLQTIDGCDVVLNLIGILYELKNNDFYKIHVDIAEKIAKFAKIKNIPMMIHFSAMGIINNKFSKYAKSKLDGEKAVISSFPEVIIIRPSIVFGKEDNFFNKFAKLATILPVLPLINNGKTKFQPIYVVDIAEIIYRIINLNKIDKKTYNIGGPKIYSFKDLLRFILNVINRKCLLFNISIKTAKLMAFFFERKIISIFLKPIIGNTCPLLTRDYVNIIQYSSIEKLTDLEEIKIYPVSIEDIVPKYLKIYKNIN